MRSEYVDEYATYKYEFAYESRVGYMTSRISISCEPANHVNGKLRYRYDLTNPLWLEAVAAVTNHLLLLTPQNVCQDPMRDYRLLAMQ